MGEEIETLVSNDQVRESWSKNQWWYREAWVTRYRAYVKGQTTWPIPEEKGRARQIEGDFHFRTLKRNIK